MLTNRRRKGRSVGALAVAVLLLGNAARAQEMGLQWTLASDGSWIADAISVGNHGTQVFTEYGAYANRAVLLSSHDVSPPAPVWEEVGVVSNQHRSVVSSHERDVHVAMHQRLREGSTSVRRAVLRKYSSVPGAQDWSREIPVDIQGHSYNRVGISSDGRRIVAVVYDFAQGKTRVELLSDLGEQPLAVHMVQTMGPFLGLALSSDARKLMLASSMRITILDVDTGAIELNRSLSSAPNYGAVALSGNGRMAAFGTIGQIWLFERGEQGTYEQLQSLSLPQAVYCRRVAISDDASTLVAGLFLTSNPGRAHVRAYDLASGAITMERLLQGSGTFQNQVERISFSADGQRFAVGLWGDEGGIVPEVLVFERDQSEPVFTYDLPGSVMALDLSPRGDFLAVASKGVHANVAGGGGAFWLFRTSPSDLGLEGVPSIGAGVAVAHRLEAGNSSRVLVAPFLGAQPETFGPAGTLYLDRASMRFLSGTRAAGTDGVARHPLAIPSDPTLIGTSLYYQGLEVGPRRLSKDWVKMTLLP